MGIVRGISVAKLISSSTFGHGFLRNLSISRKFLVVFAVLMMSLAALASISITGMRTISGTFDSAAGAYTASKLAAQIETNVARVIAAQNQYLRMSGDAQAQGVVIGIDQMTDIALIKIDGQNLPTVVVGVPMDAPRPAGRHS